MTTTVLLVVCDDADTADALQSALARHPEVTAVAGAYATPYLDGDGLGGAPGRERVAAFRSACVRAAGHSGAGAWVNVLTLDEVDALGTAPGQPDPRGLLLGVLDDVRVAVTAGREDWREAAADRGGVVVDADLPPPGTARTIVGALGLEPAPLDLDGEEGVDPDASSRDEPTEQA